MFRRIFASVSDKTGLVDFLAPFAEDGATIVSSGGTAKTLMEAGLEVTEVSDYTGFPEVMGGRVKTLHPKVHMGLLYRADESSDLDLLAKHGVEPFDLVVANLYPFAKAKDDGKSGAELIEYIDIGGPSLLRAAAKNHESVCVVCDPRDYDWVSQKESLTLDDRRYLAAKVFQKTSSYDQMICNSLYDDLDGSEDRPRPFHLRTDLVSTLRYGENPQQKARWYKTELRGLHEAQVLQGKALSFNNLLDLQSACSTLRVLPGAQKAVAIKHNNPCGVSCDESSDVALKQALKADPVSVFGGIVAVNFTLEPKHTEALTSLFLECVVAPEITPAALEQLSAKPNLRVLQWPTLLDYRPQLDVKSVDGGLLVQDADELALPWEEMSFVGAVPNGEEKKQLEFAWGVCSQLKSNAIAVTSGYTSLGLGMGQVNRVDAVKQAFGRAKEFHPERPPAILASDAFFPFADSIEYAAEQGVKWVIQPGGSIKDKEVIAAAEKHGLQMALVGRRHFKH